MTGVNRDAVTGTDGDADRDRGFPAGGTDSPMVGPNRTRTGSPHLTAAGGR
jgi:hypothetical protein